MIEHEQQRANGSIEAAFAAAEADAEAALKAATGLVKALKRAQGAARQGQVRDWQTAVEAARQGMSTLDRQVDNLGVSWQFDEEGYLQSGAFGQELVERASADGVRISELDNRLYCYPALIRVLPGDRAVLIDKKRERRLRPSVLVRHLRDLQKRPPRFRPADFLNALYAAYRVAVARKEGRAPGAVVPLGELYELLTLLPGQSREYAKQEFARDIYLLDQSGETTTKDGARLEFPLGCRRQAAARRPLGRDPARRREDVPRHLIRRGRRCVAVYIRLDEWLATVEGDYLRDFVAHGGAAVKFAVVPSPDAAAGLRAELERVARAAECQFAFLDAAATKLHMVDALFFAVARQIDWDHLARSVVRRLLERDGFTPPPEGQRLEFGAIARLNQYDESELRRDVRLMLTGQVFRDYAMAQEFRIAMLRLCQAQLDPADARQAEAKAIKEWLRGELRTITALKPALIFQRIARHNARAMLLSLAHWLRLAGCQGLVLTLDIDRYLTDRWPANRDGSSLYHTTTAVLDAYEVLRQFVDATDELEGCFIAVIAPPSFLEDPKRGLHRYDPLKLRIWDEVRDRRRANPLASLVRLTAS